MHQQLTIIHGMNTKPIDNRDFILFVLDKCISEFNDRIIHFRTLDGNKNSYIVNQINKFRQSVHDLELVKSYFTPEF